MENIKQKHSSNSILIFLILFIILIALFLVSLGIGRYSISPLDVLGVIWSKISNHKDVYPEMYYNIIFKVRLPRIIAAMLVGACLSTAGAVFQGMFKNPMVSPDILGVSAGAGFGAAIAIFFGFKLIGIQFLALLFGLISVGITYSISKIYKNNSTLVMVLAGIVVGGFFRSGISIIKYIADPDSELNTIVFWLMGSLTKVTSVDLLYMGFPIVIGLAILIALRWRLNILSLGNMEAKSLGIDIKKIQGLVILSSTIVTASAVCISGTIGWVGLIIPHMSRMLFGSNHRRMLPASCLLGAIFLIFIDNIARTLTGAEIPLGILTGLVGSPFFGYLLIKKRVKWS